MLHLLQLGPYKVLTTFPLQIQSSWQLSILELPPPCHNTVTPSSDSSDMYTFDVQSGPPSANAALLPQPSSPNILSPICPLYIFSLCSLTTVPCSWLSLCTPCFLSPWLSQGFLMECWRSSSQEQHYFTFYRPTLSTSSVSRNPILTHLYFSGFPGSLLCVLIAPTPGLAFFLLMPRTLAAALSFSSGRAYLFLNFLPPFFLRLIPTLIM